ncbi:hypothetical protein [Telluribacter sp. SYSU D00476]|uniref:hypothetical protein n=1 Tax=Telluribacter sp. SYSU D00476 TaxID=2811430 RepID=UPI001FF5B0F0|nr:hypothetical protein [Telluribacter sp. SYSU D00476]
MKKLLLFVLLLTATVSTFTSQDAYAQRQAPVEVGNVPPAVKAAYDAVTQPLIQFMEGSPMGLTYSGTIWSVDKGVFTGALVFIDMYGERVVFPTNTWFSPKGVQIAR